MTDPLGRRRTRPAEPGTAAASDAARMGIRIAVHLGEGGLADDGRALLDALRLGVNAVVVEVGRAAADVAALDAVCRSAAFADAVLSVEVPAGPAWSDSEVRAQVGAIAGTLERHGVRGELHAVDLRVLATATELAQDCRRVAMINSLTVATRGMHGAAGWVARAVRPGASDIDAIIDEVRRVGATGLAVPYPLLSEGFVRQADEAGMRLAVWGVAGSGRMRAAIALGVGEIWTRSREHLALLRAEVAESGFRIPEAFSRSTPPPAGPPRATPWSGFLG